MDVQLYDTTLRDGSQRAGISLSVRDKLRITRLLDEFGVPYIEGGWPGSNPKDCEYFQQVRELKLEQAKIVAFGSTRRVKVKAEEDGNLIALLEAQTPVVALVGKSSEFQARNVLGTTPEKNLEVIADSVRWMKQNGKEVVYDAEHFYDGYRDNPEYTMETLRVAAEAGADWLVLCDTNGGSLPCYVLEVTQKVKKQFSVPLGIHAHNDSEMAVANSLGAVSGGATQVQGTINGYGERCGNANLVSVIPALEIKMKKRCLPSENLKKITWLAHTVSEIANLRPDPHQPYVGSSAFAHKGGIHVAAVVKTTESYEHVSPDQVGNTRKTLVSELSGRGNIRVRASELGVEVNGLEVDVLDKIKEMENKGYQFEAAEGSFELLVRRSQKGYKPPFQLFDVMVVSEKRGDVAMFSEATVKVRVDGKVMHTAAEGDGPVHALDRAIRKALVPFYPEIDDVRLADYKVRILDPKSATAATTRVLIEAAKGDERWNTIGCSQNIIEASYIALADSLELHLLRVGAKKKAPVKA